MKDVIIVGAGPTGIVAANLCARAGLTTIAFDRAAGVYDLPRAAAVQDDVQRLLDSAGLLAPVRAACEPHVGAEFVDAAGERLMGVEFPGLQTLNGYPPLLAINQPGLETGWRKWLAGNSDAELCTSHEVFGLQTFGDHVEIEVRDLDGGGARREEARWLIAADSANSFVRKHCGIAWDSLGYDREWLVVDMECDPAVDLPPFVRQVCDPARPVTLVPMPGRQYRWEFQLKEGETREEMEDKGRIWELLEPWIGPAEARIVRAVVYRFHATIAATFRHERVFLAGDAAHQMPPFMGQGMCTGLRDAENLVWKLAAVQRGEAGEELLATYEEERRPAAQATVAHSSNAGKLIDAFADMERTGKRPPDELIAYGYGGSRQLPDLATGLLGNRGSDWVGRRIPQCRVKRAGRSGRFDDLAGAGWAILCASPGVLPGERLGRLRQALDATLLEIDDPHAASLLGEKEIAIVRPDRIVYSLGTDAEVPAPYSGRMTS